MRIKDIPLQERPREKALTFGINALSSVELLALIIGSGTKEKSALELAYQLLYEYHGLANLAKLEHPRQIKVKGIAQAKSLQILAALTLARRLHTSSSYEPIKLKTPQDVFDTYRAEFSARKRENLLLIMVDKSLTRIAESWLYQGTSRGFDLELKDIFSAVLMTGASGFLIVHNHPSNIASPSASDIKATKMIKKAAHKLDLELVDHVIITEDKYYSFALNGWN